MQSSRSNSRLAAVLHIVHQFCGKSHERHTNLFRIWVPASPSGHHVYRGGPCFDASYICVVQVVQLIVEAGPYQLVARALHTQKWSLRELLP